MNFLIYDKRGMVISGINIEPKITGNEFQCILDRFIQDMKKYHGLTVEEFDIELFRQRLLTGYDIKSCVFNFGRVNLREVRDARVD